MFSNALNDMKNQMTKDIKENNSNNEQNELKNENCIPYESLAMAYVPIQRWIETYDPETAFARGTLFPELDKPFIGEEAVRNER